MARTLRVRKLWFAAAISQGSKLKSVTANRAVAQGRADRVNLCTPARTRRIDNRRAESAIRIRVARFLCHAPYPVELVTYSEISAVRRGSTW